MVNVLLKEDYELLLERIESLEKQLFELGEEFNVAVNQSSETWHDNVPFDVVRDKQTILQHERRQLVAIRNSAKVARPSTGKKTVSIGDIVLVEGGNLKVLIAGVWSGRREVNGARAISVNSDIAKLLLGKKNGQHVELPRHSGTIRIIRQ